MSIFFDGLVPSLELCRKIPDGEFAHSELQWEEGYGTLKNAEYFADVIQRTPWEARGYKHHPAPTLQEILAEIEKAGGWCPTAYRLNDQWTVDFQDDKVDGMNDIVEQTDPDNPATAALKLWLKLKGIEA